MQPAKQSETPKRGRWRLLSTLAGLVLIVGGALIVMNLTAEEARGAAPDTQEQAVDGEEEKKAPVPVEVAAIASASGLDKYESIIEAGRDRLRPVWPRRRS